MLESEGTDWWDGESCGDIRCFPPDRFCEYDDVGGAIAVVSWAQQRRREVLNIDAVHPLIMFFYLEWVRGLEGHKDSAVCMSPFSMKAREIFPVIVLCGSKRLFHTCSFWLKSNGEVSISSHRLSSELFFNAT